MLVSCCRIRSKWRKKKSIKNSGEFICDLCNCGCETEESLIDHRQKDHVQCDLCDEMFKRKFHLKEHIRSAHSVDGKVVCDYCPKTFSSHMSRWTHTKSIHQNNWRYKCSLCDYGTAQESLYKNHARKHGENSNLRCEICNQEFKSWWRYQVHGTVVHQQSLKCEKCGKEFDKRRNLLRHISRNHASKKEKDVACEECGKLFYDKWALRSHMELHTNQKEQCPYCQYQTCHPKNLRVHIKHHVQKYDFVCEHCGKGFPYKFLLRQHMGKLHSDIGMSRLPCNLCGKTFASVQYLNVHMKSHDPDYKNRNHQCEMCGKKFLTRGMLLRHVRGHKRVIDYVCKHCNKILSSITTLKDHEKLHTNEKPYQCEICGRNFVAKRYLVTHIRTHTNEKPYSCDTCGARFSQRSSLTAHVKARGHALKQAVETVQWRLISVAEAHITN